ncbi:MAG: hypothetical protein WC012_11830, partial [Thiohalomonadaceae bacterium]
MKGSIIGLAGALTLQNNGRGDITLTADGDFSFSVKSGSDYHITIKSAPAGQQCFIKDGSGTATADVTGVRVQCVGLVANPLSRTVTVSWNDVGAARYDLYYAADPACDITNVHKCADGTMVGPVTSPHEVTGLTNGKYYSFWLEVTDSTGHSVVVETAAQPNSLS